MADSEIRYLIPSPFAQSRPDLVPPNLECVLGKGPTALAAAAWDELMWCTSVAQPEVEARRITVIRRRLPPESLKRLREMYKIRRDQVGDPRGFRTERASES